jgi:hypothetical protein
MLVQVVQASVHEARIPLHMLPFTPVQEDTKTDIQCQLAVCRTSMRYACSTGLYTMLCNATESNLGLLHASKTEAQQQARCSTRQMRESECKACPASTASKPTHRTLHTTHNSCNTHMHEVCTHDLLPITHQAKPVPCTVLE